MSSQQQPNHVTHVPIKIDVESLTKDDVLAQRERLPTPSLFQPGVQVSHRADPSRMGVVRVVDYMTNQFRIVGEPRSKWESCEHWTVLVEKSPEEKARDEAAELLRLELESLSTDEMIAIEAIIDGDDPVKALAKLNGFRRLGMIKSGTTPSAPEPKGKK